MDDAQRYKRASHAMQSGVEFSEDKSDQTPKHLRVGVNVALRDGASLAQLLIEKGIISRAEYLKAIADGMEAEADGYREKIARAAGCEKERIKLV